MSEKKIETRGRPRVNSTPITVRLAPDLLSWLDAERAKLAPEPSRPEMIRHLVTRERALDLNDAVKDVLAAFILIQNYLRDEFICEECRTDPAEACVSCQAVDLEQRLELFKEWITD